MLFPNDGERALAYRHLCSCANDSRYPSGKAAIATTSKAHSNSPSMDIAALRWSRLRFRHNSEEGSLAVAAEFFRVLPLIPTPMKKHLLFSALCLLACGNARSQTPASPVAAKPADISKLDPAMAASRATAAELDWHDVTQWGVEGREWTGQERARYFDRLPLAAEKTVTPAVWKLSRDSAGMMVRFKTDASALHVHVKLAKETLALPHMPATGVSGVDFYARDDSGKWRWVMVTKPSTQEMRVEVIKGLATGLREYAAYLPLYNGVDILEIGVPKGAKFEGLAPRQKPVVFYGTSITHGACASRPGMVHTGILGRRLDRAVVNLGFSGNGRMDAAVGDYLTQIDASVYVIDCLPNMQPADVAAKCAPLVHQLRSVKATTPIILVEDRRFTNDWITPAKAKFHDSNHAALKAAFDALIAEGIKNLHYIGGDALYGTDSEGATDASHANDLGFMRQADIFEPVLRKALAQ